MKYGQHPKVVATIPIQFKEMMFYQDMLIKKCNSNITTFEKRLKHIGEIISASLKDFIKTFGDEAFNQHYIYLSAKYLFQAKGTSFNRPGWHCDGFMSDDINYVWCDSCPTVFNDSDFNLSQDDSLSMKEMELQALDENNFTYPDYTLLRLNQFVVHRVGDVVKDGMRAFVKVTFSKDKFDLKGNTHNYEIDYNWEMRDRNLSRNIPQNK